MDGDGLRVGGAGEPGQDDAKILEDREVHFAHGLRRAAAHEFDILNKFLKQLHALLTLVARQVVGNTGDYMKLIIRLLRSLQYRAMGMNQLDLIAIARASDGSALGKLDANAIRENAVHGCSPNSRTSLALAAALVLRNLQDAVIVI